MIKEYRITTTNVSPTGPDDCVLEPTDSIYPLLASSIMGGLGAQERLAQYNDLTREQAITKITQQRETARAQGIKPGTPAWFALFPRS